MQFNKYTRHVKKCSNCNEIYIGCIKALENRVALKVSMIRLLEKKTYNISGHFYKCSRWDFKTDRKFQTDEYSLIQMKERKNFTDRFQPTSNRA